VEKASIDEAYLDLTDQVQKRIETLQKIDFKSLNSSYVVGSYSLKSTEQSDREDNLKAWLEPISELTSQNCDTNDINLAVGAIIVEELRADIFKTLGKFFFFNLYAGFIKLQFVKY
jgi:DNA polymerase eta